MLPGRQVFQKCYKVRNIMASARKVTAGVLRVGEAGAVDRITPVSRGKGQPQNRSHGRVDGQPEIFKRVHIGTAHIRWQVPQAKQTQQAVCHIKPLVRPGWFTVMESCSHAPLA